MGRPAKAHGHGCGATLCGLVRDPPHFMTSDKFAITCKNCRRIMRARGLVIIEVVHE